ncbi:PH domain-containing protein [Brevibacterium litoralis]|uniref:PH domain-containing protein n=1 Tax=Brevibacterium litoralis TaxID=3138935 RepID=UPI0032EA9C1C
MNTPPAETVVLRPRFLRVLCLVLAGIVLVAFGVLAVALFVVDWAPWVAGRDTWWLLAIGLLFAAGLYRFSAVRVVADPTGLRVHNVLGSYRLDWNQVIAVRFLPQAGEAWAQVDLSDGTTRQVHAIQAGDGEYADRAYRTFQGLLDRYTEPTE